MQPQPASLFSKPFIPWCTAHEPIRGSDLFLLKTNPCILKSKCFQSPLMVSVAGSGTHTLCFIFIFCLVLLIQCISQIPGPRELCSHSVLLSHLVVLAIYGDLACHGGLGLYCLHGFEVPWTTCELANAVWVLITLRTSCALIFSFSGCPTM